MDSAASSGGLLTPERVWSRQEVLERPCPVPAKPGVYGWFISDLDNVPTTGCHEFEGRPLLYVGISPKAPPKDGRPASRQTLRSRIRYHYRGNAYGSTLRLTLGCLLSERLGIELRLIGSGRPTFTALGEAKLSEWMASNAYVAWVTTPSPWILEESLIPANSFPLNLDMNRGHAFYPSLASLRAAARARARALPVLPR
jgi:hypothetical protein